MLCIAEGRVAGGEQPYRPGGSHLRGDEVDAHLLAPAVIVRGLGDKIQSLGQAVTGGSSFLLLGSLVENGTGVGRRVAPHVVGGDDCGDAAAAHVDLHLIIIQHVAGNIGQANGAHGALFQNLGLQALALGGEVGDHGAAGHKADGLVAPVYRHPGPHHAAAQQGDGTHTAGQMLQIGKVPVHDLTEGVILALEGFPAHKVALLGGEADGKPGQGDGVDGDLCPVRGQAQLMAVERHACFQTQGVTGTQAGGTSAQLHQAVPQPHGVLAGDIDLVADGLAGVAGLGDSYGVALQLQGVQRVFHGFGDALASGQSHEQLLGLGTLYGDGRPVGGDDGHSGVKVLDVVLQVRQVFIGVGCVDHQQVAVLFKSVEVGVVHCAAGLGGQDGVLRLVHVQSHHIAGEHVLQEGDGLGTIHQDAAHVGDVEQAAEAAGVQVLGHDVGGVLDGHFPPAEVHHGGTGCHMYVVKLGAFQFAHGDSLRSEYNLSGKEKQRRNDT